ncbi:MAG: ABC transporter substrate-binding protein [Spirochaetaceae bacterium]|nr:MAG: ABC transporter substrate-binding protein [Spirochaetaceae bacterium]
MKQFHIRPLVLLFAAAIAASFPMTAFARAVPEQAAAVTDPLLILAPSTVSSAPLLLLAEQYPDDYRVEFFTDHPQALARLIQGEADLLATGFSVGFARFQAAGDLVHVATPVWGVSALMTHRPVQRLEDLAGGVIYAPFEGSPIDIFLRAILDHRGLSDRIRIEYAPFPQAAALVGQGNADAAVLVEPIASRLEISGNAYRLMNLHDGWAEVSGGEARSPQVSLFARRRGVSQRAPKHALLEQRLRVAIEEIARDPAAVGARVAPALEVPPPIVQRAMMNTLFDLPSAAETRTLISDYARVMGLSEPDVRLYRLEE